MSETRSKSKGPRGSIGRLRLSVPAMVFLTWWMLSGLWAVLPWAWRGETFQWVAFTLGMAAAASLLPLSVLGDLVSLGTALAFAIVCASVLYLRKHNPEVERPFEVPLYPLTPILGWASVLRTGQLDGADTARALDVIERKIFLYGYIDGRNTDVWNRSDERTH